jgi:predicted aspartyl protease
MVSAGNRSLERAGFDPILCAGNEALGRSKIVSPAKGQAMALRLTAKLTALAGTAASLVACAPMASQQEAAAPTNVAQAMCALGYSAIPLRTLPSGHHVVAATLNGRPATFVVDTGAGRTVIHAPAAAGFGIETKAAPSIIGVGAAGTASIAQGKVNELSIATTRTGLEGIFAMDLKNVVRVLEPLAGGPVHGIIGQDIMQAQHAVVDVQQARLYLKPLEGQQRSGC